MDAQIFKRHLKDFYPLITKLICCDQVPTFSNMVWFQGFNETYYSARALICGYASDGCSWGSWRSLQQTTYSPNALMHGTSSSVAYISCWNIVTIGIFVQIWSTGRELDILKAHVWCNSYSLGMGFWFARNCKSPSHIFLDDAREVGLPVAHAMFFPVTYCTFGLFIYSRTGMMLLYAHYTVG